MPAAGRPATGRRGAGMTAAAATAQPAPRINTGYVVLIAASAAIGGFLFGFDSAVINGAVTAASRRRFDIVAALGTGFAVASILLGSAVGALIAGPVGRPDRPPAMPARSPPSCSRSARSARRPSPPTELIFTSGGSSSGIAVGIARVVAPGLHRRGRRPPDPWPAGVVPAAGASSSASSSRFSSTT